MSLTAGTRLGVYEVVSALGAGGMGEVYRARDTKLGRDVALKVVSESFAYDPERVARFQREAQLLAALNHPHIATIHGLEESSGAQLLVMELVEGGTLADRLKSGPIPVDEALAIARQVADALQAAHEKGIIHRDLKPVNIAFTADGQVKVLDFGLAKALDPAAAGSAIDSPAMLTHSPTLSLAATQAGVILGTAAYMAPEQAKGKPADKRSDIWAFGCVLYEMLTGKRPFEGEDVTETVAAALMREPDWSVLPPSLPPAIQMVVRRCLEKDRRRRLGDIAAAVFVLDEHEGLSTPRGTGARLPFTARPWWWAVPAVIVVVAAASWSAVRLSAPATTATPAHVAITLPPGDELADRQQPVAISPDGQYVAYAATRAGTQQLFVRPMASAEARLLSGTEGATFPFFSPNGQWIGFIALNVLKKVPLNGGAPTVVVQPVVGAAAWGDDDSIVYTPSVTSGLWRVSASGGEPTELTSPDRSKGESSHRWPQIVAGGRALVFTVLRGFGWDESSIVVHDLATGERRTLVEGGLTGYVTPSGHLVYGRAGALQALPFDMARLEIAGNTPVTVVEGLKESAFSGWEFSIAPSGSLVYVPGASYNSRLVWVARDGREEPLGTPLRAYTNPTLASDGRYAAIQVFSNTVDLWLIEVARGTLSRLRTEGGGQDPLWTPDALRIAYRRTEGGARNIYWQAADGTAAEEQLTTGDGQQVPNSWSPDGRYLAFSWLGEDVRTSMDIWMLDMTDRRVSPFVQTPASEGSAAFSPDGQWVAYRSNVSGRDEVYARRFGGAGREYQISTDGGSQPTWHRNGRELFYRVGERMMRVPLSYEGGFAAGRAEVLFERRYGGVDSAWRPIYDIAPDGERFLMVKNDEDPRAGTRLNLVLNWFEELKRLVPAN